MEVTRVMDAQPIWRLWLWPWPGSQMVRAARSVTCGGPKQTCLVQGPGGIAWPSK
jgi:hypothetical protein